MTKVCHITSAHKIGDERIFLKQCGSLAKAGYEVVLVGPHANDERIAGVQIRAIARRVNRLRRMTQAVWDCFRRALREKAALYHFHDAELIPAGLLLRACGKRVVYDVHEDYAGSIRFRHWIHPLLRRLVADAFGLFEKSAALFFNGIVAATPAIAARFPGRKTITARNYPILDEFRQEAPIAYAARPNEVGYIGGISLLRGIREMVAAVGSIPERLDARLVIVGSFSPAALEEEMRRQAGWSRVRFHGWTSRRTVAEMLGRVKMGLVLFHPVPNHIESQPNKLFEYMSAGVPVLASDFPLWRGIVEGSGCGLLVDPLDPEAIAQAVIWLLEHPEEGAAMGRRGQEAVRKQYNWQAESANLTALYKEIIG